MRWRGGPDCPEAMLFVLRKTCPEHGYCEYEWAQDFEEVVSHVVGAIDIAATDYCTEVAFPFDLWEEFGKGSPEESSEWAARTEAIRAAHWRLVELRRRLDQIATGSVVDEEDAIRAEALFNDLFADMNPGFEAVRIGGIETVLRRLWTPREAAMASDVTDAEGRLAELLATDAFDALNREHFEVARTFLAPHDGYRMWSDRGEPGGQSPLQEWLDTPASRCAMAMGA